MSDPTGRQTVLDGVALQQHYSFVCQNDMNCMGQKAVTESVATASAVACLAGSCGPAIGAVVSGVAGGAVEAGDQIINTPSHTVENPGAVVDAVLDSTASGAVANVGGRIAGTPGAGVGAAAAARATGATDEEAAWAGVGAAVGRIVFPNRQGESLGSALGRQLFRSLFGKTAGRAGEAVSHPNADPSGCSGSHNDCSR